MSDSNNTGNGTTTEEGGADQTTSGFLTALGIGVGVGIVLVLLFCFLRTRIPDVYQLRALLNTWKSHINYNGARVGVVEPIPDDSFFGWVKPVFTVPEDQVVRKIGLDAAMFFRFMRTAFYISALLSIFGIVILMPVYGTGNLHKDDEKIRGLRIVSLANVFPKNDRFWATVIAEFFTAAVVVVFMAIDFKHFANLRRKYRVSDNPTNYTVVVYDIPKDSRTEAAVRERFETMVPGQVSSIALIRNPSPSLKLIKKLDAAVSKREVTEYIRANKDTEPMTRPGFCGALMFFRPKVNAHQHWAEEQERLADELHDQGSEAEPTPSAIVILTNKQAASLLVQVNSRTGATEWHVERAPEPEGVHWGAFKVPGYQAEIRAIVVAVFILLFTLLWTIPATFIVGLSSIKGLVEYDSFKWARGILEWNGYLVGLIEGLLPPIIMSVLISLIPVLFRFVIRFERISSVARIEVKTRDFFYIFTIYGSFFVILIGASFFQNPDELRENYIRIIDMLAKAIPGTSLTFATFIVVRSLIPFPLMLSGVIRAAIRGIMLKFLAKTERSRRAARSGGSVFPYFQQYGFGMFTLFLSLAFSSLAPIVPLMATVYFGLGYICFRYVIMYTTYSPWDGGGELFTGTYWGTMFGLLLKQAIAIAVLGLKKAAVPSALCVIPLIITLCFTFILSHRYQRVANHGSILDLNEQPKAKDEADKPERLPARYKTVYQQPAGMIKNYENLNGVADIHDVYSDVEVYDDSDQMDAVHSETFDDNVGYVPDAAADREDV